MTNFNFLSKSGSQSMGLSSVTLASTVGSPSAHRRGTTLKHMTFVLLFLFVGIENVWGETITFTPTSTSGGTLSGAPTGVSATFANTYTNNNASGYQMTSGNSQTLTLSGFAGYTITGVTVHVKTNASKGGGSGTLTINGQSKGTLEATGVIGGTYTNKSFSVTSTTVNNGQNVVIVLTASANSFYCDEYTISYSSPAPATPYAVTFTKTDGTTVVETEESAGAGVTPPTLQASCDDWEFQGWSTSQSNSPSSTTVLNTVNLTTGKFFPSENITLYPVYTKVGSSAFSSYTQVSLGGTITSGKYIVSTGSYSKNNSSASGGGSFSPGGEENTDYELMITQYSTFFTIQLANGNYLGATDGTGIQNNADKEEDADYQWSYNSNGIYNSSRQRYMRATASDFRNYKTNNNYSNSTQAKLYKRTETTATCYYSYPTCTPPCDELGSINGSVSLTQLANGKLQASWPSQTTTDGWATPGIVIKIYEDGEETPVVTSSALANNTTSFTATDFTPKKCTQYYATLTATHGTDASYCAGDLVSAASEKITTAGYSYTITLTNDLASISSGGTQATTCDGNYSAVFAAISGYDLPGTITVTNAGTLGNGYTWDQASGALSIDASKVTGDVAVTITATVKACTPLGTPSGFSVSGKAWPYNAAALSWTAVEHADKYKVYIYNSDKTVEIEHNDAVTSATYALTQTLEAGKTYKYTVQAISNTPGTWCASEVAEGSFTMDALPEVQLNLVQLKDADAIDGGTHTLGVEFNLPTSAVTCTKTLVGWTTAEYKNYEHASDAPAVLLTKYTFESNKAVTLYAVYADVTPASTSYVETAFADLVSGDEVVYVGNDGNNKALSNDNGTSSAPSAVAVSLSGTALATTPADNICWVITKGETNFSLTKKGSTDKLYCTNTGDGVRVGTTNDNTLFVIDKDYLKNTAVNRYVGIYSNTQWRCYSLDNGVIHNNISGQTFKFYKKNVTAEDRTNYATTCLEQVATPVISGVTGGQTYTFAQTVTITAVEGATIHYTTDGNPPTDQSATYPDGGITLNTGGVHTVKAIAVKEGYANSEVASVTITLDLPYSLADFVAQKPTDEVTVDITGAIVMGRQNYRVYVQKDDAAMSLYYEDGAPEWTVGKQIANGLIKGSYDEDYYEMNVTVTGSPTANVDGVLPTPLLITDDNAATLMVEANMYRYAQMNSVTLDYDNDSYLNAYSTTSDKTYYYEDLFSVLGTLPLSTTECSVKGIITPYTSNEVYHFDQLSPILANDISTNATAVLPTISDLGGADAAHAVEVAEGKEITITEDANFDAIYQINDGAETAINTSAVVTITNTSVATKLYVKASRDYYADNAITYYYIANSALTEHMITCATGLAGGSISADKSAAVNGATVTLTPTPNDHYSLTSWTVTYNDGELKTIDVVNNQFEMPSYDVNVTAEFAEDAYATVSFAKGDEAVTGDVPANQKVYVGNNATMPANPFTYAGHNFAGWKYNETTKQAGETYAVTATGSITFTAQWIANPICTVTLHAKGAEDAVHNVVQGSTLDIPAAADFAGYTFVGWADAAQTEETTNVVTVVNSFTPEVQAQASTKDFYAVYTRQEGTSKYTKVTAAPSNWSGTYLIVYEDGNVAFNGGLETLDATNNTIDVTITDNTIASSETTDAASFTIASITGGYSVRSASGKYIGREKFDNGLDQSSSSSYTNSISYSNGNVDISSSSTTLKFNSASNQNRFRYFKSGQQDIQLYKYSDATVYYTTNPTIKYNVSYDLGEGAWRANEGCDASIVNAGTVYDVVCDDQPVLANKVFDKWQVNDADIELPYTINANTTFTAVYRDAVQYAVNYDANGGVGSAPAATNVLEAADYTVLANAWFFRSGYTFEGWNTAADGTGAAYAADAVMAMPSADVTLYAQWQVMPANEKEVVIVAKSGNSYYAMGQTFSNTTFNAVAVLGVSNDKVIIPNNFTTENKTAITWRMSTENNGATASFFSPSNNKYLTLDGDNLAWSNTPVDWTWNSTKQCYVIGSGTRTFMYRNGYNFKGYSTQNIGSNSYTDAIYVTTAFAKQITTADATETSLSLGDNIVVQNGATLTIGNQQFINDVVVENGGNLTLNANVSVHDLILHSTLGKGTGTSTSGNAPGSCGQIANGSNITVNGDVYLELELTQDAAASAGWYAFSVPFPVDAMNGVYYGNTKLQNEVGYAIMKYHGDIRAQGQYAWKKYRDIMEPGVLYIIAVGDTDYKTLRFKKHGTDAFNVNPNVSVKSYPVAGDVPTTNRGWNGIGNPNMQISYLPETNKVTYMQFLIHEENRFQVRTRSNVNVVVGSAFFVQYSGNSDATIEITPGLQDGANGYLAPKRERNAIEETIYEVELTNVATEEVEDNIFLTAREEALNEYEVGRDLAKMSMGNAKCAQMWVPAYGTQLCAADFQLINDKAEYPLIINTPKAGTYSINAQENENATIYLTYNGRAIWNLSMSACELELAQGQNEGYGLRLVVNAPSVVTGVDQIDAKAGAQKVIIDEHVYILRGGQMYDVNGKMVK